MKKIKFFALLFVAFIAALVFAGCDGKGKVIAVVNGDNIYESTYDDMVEGLYAAQGTEATEEQKKQVYDSLITSKLIEQECQNLNIAVSDKDVDEYITNIAKANGLSNADFFKQLKDAYGYSSDFVEFLIKSTLEEQALYNHVTANVAALDEAGYQGIYNADPGKYKMVQVSHILTKVDATTDDAAAYAKSLDLISQLNSGADFAELAKANSADGSASDGGKLSDYITADNSTYVSEFVAGAMSLGKTGDYTTAPVKTEYGYHIIKADSVLASYDEVKAVLKETVDNENREKAYNDYLAALKSKADIEDKLDFGN